MVKLSFHGQFKVMLFWVAHGQIDGHFMVRSRSCCSGLTMVDHGLIMVKLMVISWSVEGYVVLG